MTKLIIKCTTEFEGPRLDSNFELWTVMDLQRGLADGRDDLGAAWRNREYHLTSSTITAEWNRNLIGKHNKKYDTRVSPHEVDELAKMPPNMKDAVHEDCLTGLLTSDGPRFYRMSFSYPSCEELHPSELIERWHKNQCGLWVKRGVSAFEAGVVA